METVDTMAIFIYNTLSRSKERFVPIDSEEVRMFVCGQTVYDEAHMGHAKTYIDFDIVVRWLRSSGYKVKYIQNITDVDDKIIARAEEKQMTPTALARKYEGLFLEDMEAIGVRKNVDLYPRSHDYIGAIRDQIQLLFDNGYAYAVGDNAYYDVSKFRDYTKLSGMKIEELKKHRIESPEGKRNVYDFALWKAVKKETEPQWEIEVVIEGERRKLRGRPGWHIEDTAIVHSFFGPQYDLHGGASELIFPHHTNEIAQSEAAFGISPYVKYWMHSGVFNIRGEKMSKSLRNYISIREVLSKHGPEDIRMAICSTHYRKDIEYREEIISNAARRVNYLYASMSSFYNMKEGQGDRDGEALAIASRMDVGFKEAMDDDFNTPLALSRLEIAAGELKDFAESNDAIEKGTKIAIVDAIRKKAWVLGLLENDSFKEPLPEEARKMIGEREEMRKKRKFEESDRIRDDIRSRFGIELEDTEQGTAWSRKSWRGKDRTG